MSRAIILGTIVMLLLAFLIRSPQTTPAPNELSEDQLSLYKMPGDVLAALSQAESSGLPVLGIRTDGPKHAIPVLMYHYVEHVKDANDKIRISLNTLPENLDQQIVTLTQAGFTFLTASDLADILDGIKTVPQKPVVLTFDDGYRDFYTDAFPIIKKHQVKAVAYVVSGFANLPNYLTAPQLAEIAKSKLVEIGAHTVHHLALGGLSLTQSREEIENSKLQLERELNIPITAFAYPYGSFDLQAVQLVKKAGFRTAVSTLPGTLVDNSVRFFIHRVRPGAATGPALLSLLNKTTSQ